MAHEVGGISGGAFDLVHAANGGVGGMRLFGEQVRISANNAEEITELVGNGFDARAGEELIAVVEILRHLRTFFWINAGVL